jgi:hypothetical protein
MNIGHRIFIVEENAIFPLSQKAFNDLHSGKGILPKYAGQSIQIAVITYTLYQRKPEAIVQIDCERTRILGDGSIDKQHELDGLHLAANRIWHPETKPQTTGSVLDATSRFEGRQWDHRHPKLTGSSYKRILNALFG